MSDMPREAYRPQVAAAVAYIWWRMLQFGMKCMASIRGGLPLAALVLLAGPWLPAHGQDQAPSDAAAQPWEPMLLAAQYNGIHQHLDPFSAAYSGHLSLPATGADETSQTIGIYFGMALSSHWQSYLDIERFTGGGWATPTASPAQPMVTW